MVAIQQPLFEPPSSWTMPTELPELRGRTKWISVDVESYDPELKSKGPGFPRKDAHIVGISLAAEGGFKRYFPVRHGTGPNLAPNVVFPWLREQLGGDEEKVGAYLIYDMEALAYEGVELKGPLYDVQVADALIDENHRSYGLEAVSQRWLGYGKDDSVLKDTATLYGPQKKRPKNWRAHQELWKMNAKYVGEYAEADADNPVKIRELQRPELDKQDLWRVMDLEHKILRPLLAMRLKGIPVSVERAIEVKKILKGLESALQDKIKSLVGRFADIWSAKDLEPLFIKAGIDVPRTGKGNLSITSDWLKSLAGNEFADSLARCRKIHICHRDYATDMIELSVDGRLYSRFNSVKSGENDDEDADADGTRTGRFSSTMPNLQQVPSRDEELAPLIRSIVIAEPGKVRFKGDYSQQEPRWLIHLAALRKMKGSEEAVAAFRKDPKTDYHNMVQEIVRRESGTLYERRTIKYMNLGLMYAMGLKKLCKNLGISEDEGKRILTNYHGAIPFARGLLDECMDLANERGYIRTHSGRRVHFSLFEPDKKQFRKNDDRKYMYYRPLPLEAASKQWMGLILVRAHTHKALNGALQGSSADQAKTAVNDLYYDHGKTGDLLVHDEIGGSVDGPEEAKIYKHVMEHCIELQIPVVADCGIGPNWALCKEVVQ